MWSVTTSRTTAGTKSPTFHPDAVGQVRVGCWCMTGFNGYVKLVLAEQDFAAQ